MPHILTVLKERAAKEPIPAEPATTPLQWELLIHNYTDWIPGSGNVPYCSYSLRVFDNRPTIMDIERLTLSSIRKDFDLEDLFEDRKPIEQEGVVDSRRWDMKPLREFYPNLVKSIYPTWGKLYIEQPLLTIFSKDPPSGITKFNQTVHPLDELRILQEIIAEIEVRDPHIFKLTKHARTTHIGSRPLDYDIRTKLIYLHDEICADFARHYTEDPS